MLAKHGKRRAENPNKNAYWMSYSDMMAALLLMFILLLFLSFNRYLTLQETKEAELADKEAQLTLQEDELAKARLELDEQQNELMTIRSLLNTKQLQLGEQQLELNDKTNALAKSQEELEASQAQLEESQLSLATSQEELEQSLAQLILQQAKIEEQERLLALSQDEIDEAKRQLDAYSEQLNAYSDELESREILLSAKDAELLIEKLRVSDLETLLTAQAQQIDELVGVRARIIEQLRDAFAREGLEVNVDTQTGAITLKDAVFFDTDKAVLKPEGRAVLEQIIPLYFHTLMKDENAEYVSEIIIEGHTDSDGSYEHNLDLSQRRALAVVSFCLGDSFEGMSRSEKEELRGMITANGRSESQIIYNPDGTENKESSRRVEIKFRLKDSEMIDSMQSIFEQRDLIGAEG